MKDEERVKLKMENKSACWEATQRCYSPEDRGRADVLRQKEQETARAAVELKQPEEPEEEEPESTPPVKKSKKAPTGKATKATPARSVAAPPPPVQAQPPSQIPETSMQQGKTASEDTEEK
ncbi:uncharacterized protein LOC131007952 [Salvia miltiorrhiza]|uniref:uncharacterized protein LOC131007952 n=1 Tax=Salvia miltiorrhiza TaxID=226208 RepID=UPI0025AD6DF3|nr:uncharacterized protein LOC131007952 [Salvia miltiorrhiza]